MRDGTETNNGSLVSVRLPTFDGKNSDFIIWDCKFMARARYYGYASIIDGTTKVINKTQYIAIMTKAKADRDATEKAEAKGYANRIVEPVLHPGTGV